MTEILKSSKLSSFKIVVLYAIVSAVYIYTSDYILEWFTNDAELITKLQTYKGIGFIVITSILLYVLVKKNLDITSSYYQEIIDLQQAKDNLLLKSQEEYMLLFNHSPLPMWLFDTESYKFLLVNDAACLMYGYTNEEYMAMNLRDIRPTEDIAIMEQLLKKSEKNNSAIDYNIVRHRKKNGEIIHVKIKTTFITFNNKQVRLASAVDITTEMNTQEELKSVISRLKVASDVAGLGYWTNDLTTYNIQWSEEVYRIFEVDPETFELTLDSIKSMFHPDEQGNFDANWHTQFRDNTIFEAERKIITGTGKTKWILERISLIKDIEGNPARLEGIVLDITSRKLNEQEVYESNERFKIIAKATVEAIVDWDIKNDKVIWGEGFHTLFGYDLSVYDNYLWSNNIYPEDRESVINDLNKVLEDPTKEYFNAEFRFLKANREVTYVQHKGIIIRDSNGKAVRALAAMIDLTETLNRLNKIETQNKLLRDIAWTQSHIVRAPLANLQGFIKLLKDDIITNPEKIDAKLMDYILDSTDKLDEIIKDIVMKTRDIDDSK